MQYFSSRNKSKTNPKQLNKNICKTVAQMDANKNILIDIFISRKFRK